MIKGLFKKLREKKERNLNRLAFYKNRVIHVYVLTRFVSFENCDILCYQGSSFDSCHFNKCRMWTKK